MFRFLFISFALIGFSVAGPADVIKKCAKADSKCMKESTAGAIPAFIKGIPELGIEPMEPLHFKEIDASSPSLKFIVREVNIDGLSTCKPKKIQRDDSKSQLYIRLLCDVKGDGLYEMKGNLLVVPIEGNDKVHMKINKFSLNADLDMDMKTGPDGKKYWVIKDWRFSFELKEKADLVFENLFENNAVLRSAAQELIAQNSNEIIYEIGEPIVKAVAEKIIANVKAFFAHIPYDELSLD